MKGNLTRGMRRAARVSLDKFGLQVKHTSLGQDLDADLTLLLGRENPLTILDVGANEGQTALRLARNFKNAAIYSFEPATSVYPRLVENVKPYKNVMPIHCGVGVRPGMQTLYIHQSSTKTNSVLKPNPERVKDAIVGEEKIELVSVDEFAAKRQLGAIDLLKIDTEGYDLEVMRGAAGMFERNKIRLVMSEVRFIEYHYGQAFFGEIYSFLQGFGLQLVGLYHCSYTADGAIAWGDALFVNPTWRGSGEAAKR